MKKLLAVIVLMAAPVFSYSAEVLPINQFSGINTDDSPLSLQNGQTPDSENVVTDEGFGIRGRSGYIRYSTESASSFIAEFPLSNGTRYLITRSGSNLKATTDGTFSVLVGTVPTDRTIAYATLGDKFFYSDTLNGLKYWNGTSVTVASAAMTVDKLVAWKGRLAAAGKSGSERVIFLSKYLDGTLWTLQTNPTDDDPAQITISGALDENIQALYASFQDKLIWYKKTSFGGLYGNRRSNFINRTFSDRIGVSSVETIQDCDGRLRWLGNNKKVYEFDGANFESISDQIDNIFTNVSQGDSNNRVLTVTTSENFEEGSYINKVEVDTITTAGSIRLNYSDNFDTYRNGSGGIKQSWYNGAPSPTFQSTSVAIVGGKLYANSYNTGGLSPKFFVGATSTSTYISNMGTTFYFEINDLSLVATSAFYFILKKQVFAATTTVTTLTSTNDRFYAAFISSESGKIYLQSADANGVNPPSATSGQFTLPINFSFFITPSTFQFTINGSSIVGRGSHVWPTTGSIHPHFVYSSNLVGTDVRGFKIDDFSVVPETATYITKALDFGSQVTSYGAFTGVSQQTGGSVTYEFQSSTNSDTSLFLSTGWIPITTGFSSTATVRRYGAIRSYMYASSPVATIGLDSLQFNYNEGSNIKASSGYVDKRYWLGLAISSTSNNKILVYDRNRQWQRYSGYIPEVMGIYSTRLYVGDTHGVYLTESGYNDNGNQISSYFQTKVLIPSSIDLYSKYIETRITSEQSDATLTISDEIDDNGSFYSLGSLTMDQKLGIQNLKFPFTSSNRQQGKFISIKMSILGTSFWRILNGNLYFDRDLLPD